MFKITTGSKHSYLLVENVLNRQYLVAQPSKAWFANVLESYKVTRSMNRIGNCWDNAVAESFF